MSVIKLFQKARQGNGERSHMAGYSHPNYFRKVFKAPKGIRPDKFKKPSSQYGFVREVLETPGIFLFPRNLVTPNRRTLTISTVSLP